MLGVITGSLKLDKIQSKVNKQLVVADRHAGAMRKLPHEIDYVSLITGMKDRGVDRIVAFHTVGSIGWWLEPGSIVVPRDVIDYTCGRDQGHWANPHMDVTHIFHTEWRQSVISTVSTMGYTLFPAGVMGVTQGPRLETPAEIARMARDGCQVVGMTAMPEAYVAKQLGIPYCSVALVVNKAAGLADPNSLTPEAMKAVSQGFIRVAEDLVCSLA